MWVRILTIELLTAPVAMPDGSRLVPDIKGLIEASDMIPLTPQFTVPTVSWQSTCARSVH